MGAEVALSGVELQSQNPQKAQLLSTLQLFGDREL